MNRVNSCIDFDVDDSTINIAVVTGNCSLPFLVYDYYYASHTYSASMRPIITDVKWSMCVSVYLSVGHNHEPYENG